MNAATVIERPRHAGIETVITFSVDVVDGNGLPVAFQEVAALYRYVGAPSLETLATTDADGRARFADHHSVLPVDVTLCSGKEESGPHPLQREVFTIEM